MDGFVTSHIAADVNGPEDGPYTMGYLERNDIPFHYALAGHPDYTPAAGADFVASKIDAIAANPGRPGSSWTGCRSAAGSGCRA